MKKTELRSVCLWREKTARELLMERKWDEHMKRIYHEPCKVREKEVEDE